MALLVAYVPSLGVSPLLDEQFLQAWAKNAGQGGFNFADFLYFQGMRPNDAWSVLTPLSLKVTALTDFGSTFWWRFQSLLIHFVSCCAYGAIALKFASVPVAVGLTILFAIMPNSAESVVWIGGRGVILSVMFWLCAVLFFLQARQVTNGRYGSIALSTSLRWLAASIAMYAFSLLSSVAIWVTALSFAVLEYSLWWRTPREQRADGTLALIGPLLMVVLAGAVVAASSVFSALTARTIAMPSNYVLLSGLFLIGLVFLPRLPKSIALGAVICGILLAGWLNAQYMRSFSDSANTTLIFQTTVKQALPAASSANIVLSSVPFAAAIAPAFRRESIQVFHRHSALLASPYVSARAQEISPRTTGGDGRSPDFDIALRSADGTAVSIPAFCFPTIPELGLFAAPRGTASIPIKYSCSNVANAAGVLVEISMPNADVALGPPDRLSGVTLTTLPINGVKGSSEIPVEKFPEAGIYSLRAIAINEAHDPIGTFSETLYLHVNRPRSPGWNEQ